MKHSNIMLVLLLLIICATTIVATPTPTAANNGTTAPTNIGNSTISPNTTNNVLTTALPTDTPNPNLDPTATPTPTPTSAPTGPTVRPGPVINYRRFLADDCKVFMTDSGRYWYPDTCYGMNSDVWVGWGLQGTRDISYHNWFKLSVVGPSDFNPGYRMVIVFYDDPDCYRRVMYESQTFYPGQCYHDPRPPNGYMRWDIEQTPVDTPAPPTQPPPPPPQPTLTPPPTRTPAWPPVSPTPTPTTFRNSSNRVADPCGILVVMMLIVMVVAGGLGVNM